MSAATKAKPAARSAAGNGASAITAPQAAPASQSAAAPSPFTPIANYGFISDCHTGALVAPDGAIDWLCVPGFDSPSVFGSLLDRGAGAFRLGPFGINVPSGRSYEPGTNTLITAWKLMCWVALDRAAKLAEIRGEDALVAEWAQTAEEIKADILEHGVDKRGVLCQHYGTDSLDASTLLAAMFGFLPGSDKRLHASVLAIADELTEDGFVLRYRTDETDDGLSGKEGTFLICSFWLVSALAIIGELQRARDLMERLARIASPLGLYAEEFDVDTGRHLGNFPQAFSHLALVEAAGRIILAERLQELN